MYGRKNGSGILSKTLANPIIRRWATLARLLRPGNRGITILCYHSVKEKSDFFCRSLAPSLFRKQLKRLKRWCRFISLDEATEELVSAKSCSRKGVVVTFDDGYRDNYTHAFPILKELGIPATVFLTTDHIGTNKLLWHDRLAFYLRSLDQIDEADLEQQLLEVLEKTSPLFSLLLRFREDTGDRVEKMFAIAGLMKDLGPDESMMLLDRLAEVTGSADEEDRLPRLMLDWDEIREMTGHGMTFDAHTRRHVILSRLSGKDLEEELATPREVIASRLDREAFFLAYPNGAAADMNDEVIDAAKKAGYRGACTLIPGCNVHGVDPFRLFRKGAPHSPYLFV